MASRRRQRAPIPERLIVTPQFCKGWCRPLEQQLLAVARRKKWRALPKRVQELLGYNIHPPFMGYVDGMHPGRILTAQERLIIDLLTGTLLFREENR